MTSQPRIRPTLVMPDAAPLIHLAGAGALNILNGMGRVIVTRNLLQMAEAERVIPDAAILWERILRMSPTANPLSAVTYIHPESS